MKRRHYFRQIRSLHDKNNVTRVAGTLPTSQEIAVADYLGRSAIVLSLLSCPLGNANQLLLEFKARQFQFPIEAHLAARYHTGNAHTGTVVVDNQLQDIVARRQCRHVQSMKRQ